MLLVNTSALLLLIILPFFVLFFWWRDRARAATIQRIGNPELVKMLVNRVSPAHRLLKKTLWILAIVALIIGMARPVWGVAIEPIEFKGIQIALVIDVSRSMDAQDVVPSRLGRALLDMRSLVEALAGNDLSIVLFAGETVLYLPMTYDNNTVDDFLNSVSTNSIGTQGTALESALNEAIASFDFRTGAQPVIILASDGEDHFGDALQAAITAAEQGVIIHVLGYGTEEGSVIPVYDAAGELVDFKTDSAGVLVETRIDEPILSSLADATGGIYQRVGETGAEISTITDSIATLEQGVLGDAVTVQQVERFGMFVLLALSLLSAEIILPDKRNLPYKRKE